MQQLRIHSYDSYFFSLIFTECLLYGSDFARSYGYNDKEIGKILTSTRQIAETDIKIKDPKITMKFQSK